MKNRRWMILATLLIILAFILPIGYATLNLGVDLRSCMPYVSIFNIPIPMGLAPQGYTGLCGISRNWSMVKNEKTPMRMIILDHVYDRFTINILDAGGMHELTTFRTVPGSYSMSGVAWGLRDGAVFLDATAPMYRVRIVQANGPTYGFRSKQIEKGSGDIHPLVQDLLNLSYDVDHPEWGTLVQNDLTVDDLLKALRNSNDWHEGIN